MNNVYENLVGPYLIRYISCEGMKEPVKMDKNNRVPLVFTLSSLLMVFLL